MTPLDDYMLKCHAWADHLWRPLRHYHAHPENGIVSAICAGRRAGAKLPASSGDARGWKREQRSRDTLASRGLMERGTLSPAGRRQVRSWVWLTDQDHLWFAVERIVLCEHRDWCRRGRWVPECLIVSHPWGGDTAPFAQLQIALLPGL